MGVYTPRLTLHVAGFDPTPAAVIPEPDHTEMELEVFGYDG